MICAISINPRASSNNCVTDGAVVCAERSVTLLLARQAAPSVAIHAPRVFLLLMARHTLDGGKDDKYNGDGFVQISKYLFAGLIFME